MNVFSNMKSNWNAKISGYQALDSKDKKTFWKEFFIKQGFPTPELKDTLISLKCQL